MWIKSDGTIINLDNTFEIEKSFNYLTNKDNMLKIAKDKESFSSMEFEDKESRDKVFDKIKYLLQNTTSKLFDADLYLDETRPKSKPEESIESKPELAGEIKNPNILC